MADDETLPVKLGPVSNGEFHPVPHSPTVAEAIRRTHRLADENARRLGLSRRQFLGGATGAAATFLMLAACSKEEAASRGEEPGGTFEVSTESTLDRDRALEELGGDQFVFDVQTHYVNQDLALPGGEWTSTFPHAACPEGATDGDSRACFTVDAYFREVFVRSDTTMAILSALPAPALGGLAAEDMVHAIDVATRLGCDQRVLMHGGAYPHRGPLEPALAAMTEARDTYDLAAWKIYTMTPTVDAFYFDDHDPSRPQIGQAFIDHVREIGPPIICTHKGISSIVGSTPELASPADIGPAAARNPDVSFVIYHSGFEPNSGGTGPYDPDDPDPQGVDRLIRSLADAGVEPNANVYAELGGNLVVHHARPHRRRPRAGEAAGARRRGPGGLGHRLDLVRDPPGPDPGPAHLPDRPRAAGAPRLPGAHRRAQAQDLRADLGRALRHRGAHQHLRGQPGGGRADPGLPPPGRHLRADDLERGGPADRRPPVRRRPLSAPG